MFRKTLTAAIAVAAISGSALLATSTASQAGYYGGGYGYNGGYHGGYSYAPSCFYKKVKVHGYYGWHWKRVRVCH